MILIKASSPGWSKYVADEVEAAAELWPHICGLCRNGKEEWQEAPVKENDLESMLATACGLEYEVKNDMKFKTDVEPAYSQDFYYDLFSGGYIKPEDFLEPDDAAEVRYAIQIIEAFQQGLIDNDLLEES